MSKTSGFAAAFICWLITMSVCLFLSYAFLEQANTWVSICTPFVVSEHSPELEGVQSAINSSEAPSEATSDNTFYSVEDELIRARRERNIYAVLFCLIVIYALAGVAGFVVSNVKMNRSPWIYLLMTVINILLIMVASVIPVSML
ncbi:MAG: hypothetical protein IJ757_07810 [Clostridiales bacterium]|nr:hypothetical protein [Clostridiales bacterium]